MAKISAEPIYGTHDYNKSLKDLFVIVKNTGTYGSPAYAAGSTRRITQEEYMLNMELPFSTKVTLSASQIKTGNTTPIEIVPAVTGYFIDPISAIADIIVGSVAFDDSVGEMWIEGSATGKPLLISSTGFTNDLSNKQIKMKMDILTDLPVLTDNMALNVKFSDDSTVGDGEIIIYLSYRLVKK